MVKGEYLEYWPRLRSQKDIYKYVEIRNEVAKQALLEKALSYRYYQFYLMLLTPEKS